MSETLLLIISAVLVNNFVLVKFLGLCPFMGVSNSPHAAIGMGLATGFVLTLAAGLSWIIHHGILVPLELPYLRTISFILVIAAMVQFTELVMHKLSPRLYRVLGIYLPLITTNCAVLGVALLNVQAERNFIDALLYGFGAALGFALVLLMFSSLRERLHQLAIPESFRGSPIALTTAALMALGFMGFAGIVPA